MELNLNNIVRLNTSENTTSPAGTDNYWDDTRGFSRMDAQTYSGAGTDAIGTDYPLITTDEYSRSNYKIISPWYVGQKVRYTGSIIGPGNTPAGNYVRERVITNIQFQEDGNGLETGKLEITLDTLIIGLTAGQTEASHLVPVMAVVPPATQQVDINSCEIVLRVVENPSSVPSSLSYIDYDTENDNGNANGSFRKNYQIEPNTQTVYVSFGTGISSSVGATTISDWRYSLDNISMVNRPIEWYSPHHLDLLNQAYLNKDLQIKNISQENILVNNESYSANSRANDVAVFPCLLKSEQQLLNLEFNCSANGINSLNIYKEVQKTI